MGAIVPILIPFAEVYKDTEANGVKVGMVLSIVATACSLLGSIAIAIEKARKFQETSYVGHDAAWAIYKEVFSRFVCHIFAEPHTLAPKMDFHSQGAEFCP